MEKQRCPPFSIINDSIIIKLFCKIRIKFNIFGIHNNNSLLPFKNKIKQFELPAVDFFLTLLYYTKVEEL